MAKNKEPENAKTLVLEKFLFNFEKKMEKNFEKKS